jgi:eukaryotic-like serine/threonine-protein kinase
MAFEAGQTIGEYEIIGRLGAGGLGAVYEVRHKISQRREAMKILLPDQSGTEEMAERFRREVRTLATLSHPNIAALHNAFYHDNQLIMVMELIEGETLRDRRLRSAVTLPEALDIAAKILRALVYAHALGVVHRDIKPSNIMITEAGEVKLLDFGIAIAGVPGELTHAGYLLGSVNYMSPEQVSGARATTRSDLYSLGVTLYEFLTGQLPITGKSDYEIMMGHMQQTPTPPHEIAPAIPVPLSVAIMRALAKDPALRFAAAEEFLQAIEAVADLVSDGQPVSTGASLPTPVRPSRFSERLQTNPASSSGLQSLPLDEISRKLAVYIGPVAKIIVRRLAEKSQDPDTIYHEAARQISSDADRAAFLRSRHK